VSDGLGEWGFLGLLCFFYFIVHLKSRHGFLYLLGELGLSALCVLRISSRLVVLFFSATREISLQAPLLLLFARAVICVDFAAAEPIFLGRVFGDDLYRSLGSARDLLRVLVR